MDVLSRCMGAVVGRFGPATRTLMALSLLGFSAALAACAPAHPDTRPTAECPVCRCNNDLGCLIVHIDEKTPRSEYQGRTVYFCSEECKEAFDLAPGKYPKR